MENVLIKDAEIKDPEYFSKRGTDKFNNDDFDGAIKDFNLAIKLDPENTNYFNLRGHALFSVGDLKGAKSDFNRSKKLKTKGKKAAKTVNRLKVNFLILLRHR